MELTDRQKLTLQHLEEKGITKPLDVIKFCVEKLDQPSFVNSKKRRKKLKNLPHIPRRKHSKQYYQEIINYLAQQK